MSSGDNHRHSATRPVARETLRMRPAAIQPRRVRQDKNAAPALQVKRGNWHMQGRLTTASSRRHHRSGVTPRIVTRVPTVAKFQKYSASFSVSLRQPWLVGVPKLSGVFHQE